MTNEPKTIAGPTGIWACKIGETKAALPAGADAPMRAAVERAYRELTGEQAAFTFSGWSAELTEGERAVVENRLPQSPNTAPAELPEALRLEKEFQRQRAAYLHAQSNVALLADILNRRPAVNAGLAEAYGPWYAEVYELIGAMAAAPANDGAQAAERAVPAEMALLTQGEPVVPSEGSARFNRHTQCFETAAGASVPAELVPPGSTMSMVEFLGLLAQIECREKGGQHGADI